MDLFYAGYCPDFLNINGQKALIELFGCYWHGCSLCGFKSHGNRREEDRQRLAIYSHLSFRTLVVWEHELSNETQLLETVRRFNYGTL